MENKLLNKKELSNYLGFSVGKIDTLIKDNKIEYYKIGRNVRFKIGEVKSWIGKFKSTTI